MNTKKKWLIAFALTLFLGLGCMTAVVVIVDPFFQYHKPLKGFPYSIDNQLCQNPGIAKNFDYNSVLLGSSLTLNFNTLWFEEYFGMNTVKLTYNAARPLDQDTILNVIEEHHEELDAVFLAVDIPTYSRSVNERAYPLQEYLYDDDLGNDVKYWWNKDVLLNYIAIPLIKGEQADDIHNLYNQNYDPQWYNQQVTLSKYHPSKGIGGSLENVTANMEEHILPYIEKHPDTDYYIFFPPYSILFWHSALLEDEVADNLAMYTRISEMLLEYENVRIFFFAGNAEIICNLNNYLDYTHYSQDIALYMTQCMAEGREELTRENYQERIKELGELVNQVDFSQWGL
ncbi:MAG: hypothetical protein ACI4HQ_12090 [Acetatifactor sp.]